MKIGVIGAGYVGLVTGTCLAEMGNHVCVADISEEKINSLMKGKSPHFEPGLDELLVRNIRDKRLTFSLKTQDAAQDKEAVFLAVGTPMSENGSANMTYIMNAAEEVGKHLTRETVVITKSTVPVGTNQQLHELLSNVCKEKFHVVSNPEFLKEGAALDDFMKPDRVVIGARCDYAKKIMQKIYDPFVHSGHPILFMDPESAEMVKYASNALLASRISFMNEMARICDKVGADVHKVRMGVGSDSRLGSAFLYPGLGYGGSCFPKDVRALSFIAETHGVKASLCDAIDQVNIEQRLALLPAITAEMGEDLTGKEISVWGVAFKPRTDDIREAPALYMIEELLARGAKIKAYDPVALNNAQKVLGEKIKYFDDAYEAIDGADALLICTEWSEFRSPDFKLLQQKMRGNLIFDGRNLYDLESVSGCGFTYISIGRPKIS